MVWSGWETKGMREMWQGDQPAAIESEILSGRRVSKRRVAG
jgi:hypothetical protein